MNGLHAHRRARAGASTIVMSLGMSIGACADHKLGPSVPASIVQVSGDSQTVLAGDRASAPMVAVIENSDGAPLPNVEVRWAVTSGGGSLETLVDTTDANGQARSVYLSPAIAGVAKVNALAGAQARAFTITVAPDTIGALSAYGGDGASAVVGYQVTLVAKAHDRFGNAMRGVDVAWAASSGQLQVSSGTTDSTGKTTNMITVGPDAGKVSIVASSKFNAITFTVTALSTP